MGVDPLITGNEEHHSTSQPPQISEMSLDLKNIVLENSERRSMRAGRGSLDQKHKAREKDGRGRDEKDMTK